MADLRTCENGHYYDPDMYPNGCPYCTGASVAVAAGGATAPIKPDPVGYNSYQGGGIPTSPVIPATGGPGPGITIPPSDDPVKGGTVPVNPHDDEQAPSPVVEYPEYVVGWLVAIEGPYKGMSFQIHDGYTHVGREQGDIVLPLDSKVSGVKNVSTVYASEANSFFVKAGDSRNVVYINGKPLIAGDNRPLEAYSSIKIGDTKFLFVPFCSDKFNWLDLEKQE